jgi:release factor glutamine methyltransferase
MNNTVAEVLAIAAKDIGFALKLEIADAKLEAQLLLQHVLNENRAWLIAHQNDALQANSHAAYRALINRRVNGEPIAYILGVREFYGLKLKVTVDTLIPRADTETLVEAALAKIPQNENTSSASFPRRRESMLNLNKKMDSRLRGNDELRILDLGTGTGAIALAIAKHRSQAHLTALDASQAALGIAIENAETLNITNVKFVLSDWFSAIQNEKFDVIVSNPPYIEATDSHLKQGDLRFEPLAALASGADGLDDIRTIIQNAPQHLNPHGWLLLEHGYNQADKVALLLKQAGFVEISHAKDLAGINRVTIGRLAN